MRSNNKNNKEDPHYQNPAGLPPRDFTYTGKIQLHEMVKSLADAKVLEEPLLQTAFAAIDRADFVPEESQGQAYLNQPLSIGWGQTISQPSTVAFMLSLLEVKSGDRVLEIGSGSGYQTALLAYLVNHDDTHRKGKIFALEIIPELAKQSLRNITKYRFVRQGVIEIHCLNGVKGFPSGAPFDRIIAAASGYRIPSAWQEQLKIGGRLVAPVGNEIVRLIKTGLTTFLEERFPGFSFVPFQEEG